MHKRFEAIIQNCQLMRKIYGLEYLIKCKKQLEKYSKEIIEKRLIDKCDDQYFAKQLCMVNELKWE